MKRGISHIYPKHSKIPHQVSEKKRAKTEGRLEYDQKLLLACKTGKLQLAERLIRDGANIEARNQNGHTPLLLAIQYNNLQIVKLLINSGVQINSKNNFGNSALHIAANQKNIELIKLLIKSNIDIELANNDDKTALLYTAFACTNTSDFLQQFISEIAISRGSKHPHIAENYNKILTYGQLYCKNQDALTRFNEIAKDPRSFCSLCPEQQETTIYLLFKTFPFVELDDLSILLYARAGFITKLVLEENNIIDEINNIIIFGHCFGFHGKFNYQIPEMNIDYHIPYEGHRISQTIPHLAQSLTQFNYFIQRDIPLKHFELDLTQVERFVLDWVSETFWQFSESYTESNYLAQARFFDKTKIAIFTCKWPAHVAAGILCQNRLYIINKGIGSAPGIYCFNIDPSKLPQNELKLAEFLKNLNQKYREDEGDDSILALEELKQLNPSLLYCRKLKPQHGGHCSYVSFKHVIQALFMVAKDFSVDLSPRYNNELNLNNDGQIALDIAYLDLKKLYGAFVKYNDFFTIDHFMDINQGSRNIHKFTALQKFIHNQHYNRSAKRPELNKYVSNKLLEEKFKALSQEMNIFSSDASVKLQNTTYVPLHVQAQEFSLGNEEFASPEKLSLLPRLT